MFCVGSVRVVLPAEFGTASGPLAVAVAPRFEPLPDGISELIEQGVDPRSNPRLDIEPAGFGRLRIYVIEPEAKDVPLDVRSPCASWWTGTFRNGMLAGVTGLPVGVDSRLWIRTTVGCIDFLYDAARTSPGRMEAYCPHEHHSYSVSKYEIVEMPDESAIWVDGFLAGNAPPIHEMFGRSIYGDDVDLADPRWGRWRGAIAAFRVSGRWLPMPWFELPELPATLDLPFTPWAAIGDECWRWTNQAWSIDDTIVRHHSLIAGSVCGLRRHHHSTGTYLPEYWVCDDCGYMHF
jgi:hypothetical protein